MIYKLLQNRVERTYRGGGRIEKFTDEKLSDKNLSVRGNVKILICM